jgi:hypothetical protein
MKTNRTIAGWPALAGADNHDPVQNENAAICFARYNQRGTAVKPVDTVIDQQIR